MKWPIKCRLICIVKAIIITTEPMHTLIQIQVHDE